MFCWRMARKREREGGGMRKGREKKGQNGRKESTERRVREEEGLVLEGGVDGGGFDGSFGGGGGGGGVVDGVCREAARAAHAFELRP